MKGSRAPVKKKKDKAVFSKAANNKKKINVAPPLYRGGIRL